jgi:hypothetical protein
MRRPGTIRGWFYLNRDAFRKPSPVLKRPSKTTPNMKRLISIKGCAC